MRTALVVFLLAIASVAPAAPRTLAEIKKSGVLKIATRERAGVAIKRPDGKHGGFQYCLADAFAASLGVKLAVTWRPFAFQRYFEKDGRFDPKTTADESIRYTPDVLKQNDLAVDAFSPLPWRKRLARLVPITVGRQMIVHAKDRFKGPVGSVDDLKGKTVAVKPATLQHDIVKEISRTVPLKVVMIDEKSAVTGDDLAPLKDGRGDFMVYAAIYTIVDLRNEPRLAFGFPIGSVDTVDWLLPSDAGELAEALTAFVAKAKEDGTLNRCFEPDYGLSFTRYLLALDVVKAP